MADLDQNGFLWERPHETPSLFGEEDDAHDWRREWRGMPEYSHEDHSPWRTLPVHFRCEVDMKAFIEKIGADCWNGKAFWYPAAAIGHTADKRYRSAATAAPSGPGDGNPTAEPETVDDDGGTFF